VKTVSFRCVADPFRRS